MHVINVDNMPPEILRFLVYLLSFAFMIAGATLVGMLVFMAKGVLVKLSKIEGAASEQFHTFGRQLAGVKDLVTADLHRHDVRITRLEEWKRHAAGGPVSVSDDHHEAR